MDQGRDIEDVLEAMCRRLAEAYAPERIVRIPANLGDPDTTVDIDLLVVKQTADDMEARRDFVLGLLRSVDPSVTVDALVLTPAEMERRITLGDYLLAEIMRYGRLMYPLGAE